MKQSPKSRKSGQTPNTSRLSQSRGAKHSPKEALLSFEDFSTAIRRRQWSRLLPKSTAVWRTPRATEVGGLGTEAWLGIMTFLGVVLGLVYARLTLP
jgi:hypothetical protein